MRARRRRPEIGAWIVLLILASGVWYWHAELLGALRGETPTAERDDASADATSDVVAPETADTETADTGARATDAREATPDDTALAAAPAPEDALARDDTLPADEAPANAVAPGGDAATSDAGAAGVTDDATTGEPSVAVEEGRTSSGLKRYTVHHDPSEPEAPSPARTAAETWERAPADATALATLVTALVAEGRVDEALEDAVRFAEAGGAPGQALAVLDAYDPLPLASVAALRVGVQHFTDAAETLRGKQQWLLCGALCDAAATLLDGIRAERPGPLPREDDRLADLLQRVREPLLRAPGALDAFALRDVPLPPGTDDSRSSLQRARDEGADARARDEGRPIEVTSTHYLVRTSLGSRVARDASALLEAVYERCTQRFGGDPLRTGGRVIVEILEYESAFATRRADVEPPLGAWRDGFADVGARTITVLDPEAVGEPRELLWGRLAREAGRTFVETWGPRPLPPWLSEGLPATFEGATLRRDGSVVLDRPADGLRRRVELSLAGRGATPRGVLELLGLEAVDVDDIPWCWALVTYLHDALGPDGTPLWRDRFEALLAAYHTSDASLALPEFRGQILRPDEEPRAGVATLEDFTERFAAWIAQQDALDHGVPSAVHEVLTLTQRAIDLRRFEEAESIVRRARQADPAEPFALWQAFSIAKRRGQSDEALLLAYDLASTRQPSGHWSPDTGQQEPSLEQRASSEELRFAELLEINDALGRALAEHDLALRVAVEHALDARLAAGLPRAAVRLLDRVLAAFPLDAGYRAMRAEIVARSLHPEDLVVRRPVSALADLTAAHGDVAFWTDDDGALAARCSDRVAIVTLRGLADLRAPFTVSATLRFGEASARTSASGGNLQAGFVLGGEDAALDGPWGVFATPSGRIELAHRGREEWPSRPIGRGARAPHLELLVDGTRLSVRVDGKDLHDAPLGSRPADGWLGLFVRHVDVTFEDLVVTRTRETGPGQRWYTRAAP